MQIIHTQIEIQHFFPHRNQETQVPLLTCIFLGDLQFYSFVCVLESAEKGRNRLPGLKVDWSMFDLNDDIVFEFSIQRMKVVISRLGSIILRIAPVEMMVVNKRTVKKNPTMDLPTTFNYI